jgi:uncharacterized membrane protein YqjE
MRLSANIWIVIAGIVLLVALGIFVEWRIRRSRIHSLARLRRTRVAANDALRSRLERKVVRQVEKRKQKLERSC